MSPQEASSYTAPFVFIDMVIVFVFIVFAGKEGVCCRKDEEGESGGEEENEVRRVKFCSRRMEGKFPRTVVMDERMEEEGGGVSMLYSISSIII